MGVLSRPRPRSCMLRKQGSTGADDARLDCFPDPRSRLDVLVRTTHCEICSAEGAFKAHLVRLGRATVSAVPDSVDCAGAFASSQQSGGALKLPPRRTLAAHC